MSAPKTFNISWFQYWTWFIIQIQWIWRLYSGIFKRILMAYFEFLMRNIVMYQKYATQDHTKKTTTILRNAQNKTTKIWMVFKLYLVTDIFRRIRKWKWLSPSSKPRRWLRTPELQKSTRKYWARRCRPSWRRKRRTWKPRRLKRGNQSYCK